MDIESKSLQVTWKWKWWHVGNRNWLADGGIMCYKQLFAVTSFCCLFLFDFTRNSIFGKVDVWCNLGISDTVSLDWIWLKLEMNPQKDQNECIWKMFSKHFRPKFEQMMWIFLGKLDKSIFKLLKWKNLLTELLYLMNLAQICCLIASTTAASTEIKSKPESRTIE